MNAEKLAELKRLAEAATRGQWVMYNGYGPIDDGKMRCHFIGTDKGFTEIVATRPDCADINAKREDFEFIAHLCPDNTVALIAEIERLRGIVGKLPLTADGVPIVPGMSLWRVMDFGNGKRSEPREMPPLEGYRLGKHECGEISEVLYRHGWAQVVYSWLYSTRDAAIAAKVEGKECSH